MFDVSQPDVNYICWAPLGLESFDFLRTSLCSCELICLQYRLPWSAMDAFELGDENIKVFVSSARFETETVGGEICIYPDEPSRQVRFRARVGVPLRTSRDSFYSSKPDMFHPLHILHIQVN